jgi:hypothetical protein
MAEELPSPDDRPPAHDHTFDDEPCDGCNHDDDRTYRYDRYDRYDRAEHDFVHWADHYRPDYANIRLGGHQVIADPLGVAIYDGASRDPRRIRFDSPGDR